ncbi:MAG: undecaprenyl/decaprenyl-phosphate alpha-N-acetylglucosaminyl 1-phosphate transferase [Crocinitomicaceae bacterium]|nr:undecaprenyl/decaprenyl-phosphate alpha-N-acetylglucosaminyl 1-phosphate transferase [Crocinitomicaceae bacterium]
MLFIILAFITSFFVVLLGTPSLIKVAKLKHLVDEPSEERKLHSRSVPTIAGVMIFSAFLFSICIWFPAHAISNTQAINDFKYLIAILVLLFFVGVKDDIIGTAPIYKLISHIVVGFILVMMGNIRIESMHGLFGVSDPFPEEASVFISLFVYIVIVNAINLIDGVDGLAGGVGFIATLTFGIWFQLAGVSYLSIISFSLCGALAGFLIFNFNPARIFMGDSGSLTVGAIITFLSIRLIETPANAVPEVFQYSNTAVVAMAILAYPLIDTLRVFTIRAKNGVSPFSADRNHIHHRLLSFGWNHRRTTITLYIYTSVIILVALFIPVPDPTLNFAICVGVALLLTLVLFYMKKPIQ